MKPEIISILAATALAFGSGGHEAVAKLALRILEETEPATVKRLQTMLGSRFDFEKDAEWPDSASREIGKEFSKPFHYIQTNDFSCGVDVLKSAEGCPTRNKQCATNAANYFFAGVSNAFKGKKPVANDAFGTWEPEEHIIWLIHLLGDLHQPFHAGMKGDVGGNNMEPKMDVDSLPAAWKENVRPFAGRNLHGLWDGEIVTVLANQLQEKNKTRGRSIYNLADNLFKELKAKTVLDASKKEIQAAGIKKSLIEWTAESARASCEVYSLDPKKQIKIKTGDVLGRDYIERGAAIMKTSVINGGVRLAALMSLAMAGNAKAFQTEGGFLRVPSVQGGVEATEVDLDAKFDSFVEVEVNEAGEVVRGAIMDEHGALGWVDVQSLEFRTSGKAIMTLESYDHSEEEALERM